MFKILERFERGGDDVEQQLGDTDGEVSGTAGNGIGAGKLEDLYRGLIGEGGDAEDENDDEEDDEAREELAQRLEGVDLGKFDHTSEPWIQSTPLKDPSRAFPTSCRLARPARPLCSPSRLSPKKVCRALAI